MTQAEAMRSYGLREHHLHAAERRGELQALRVGGRVFYSSRDLERLFSQGPENGGDAPVKATKDRRRQFEIAFQDAA